MDSDPVVERLTRLTQPKAPTDPVRRGHDAELPPRDPDQSSLAARSVLAQKNNILDSEGAPLEPIPNTSAAHSGFAQSRGPNDSVGSALEVLRNQLAAQSTLTGYMEQTAEVTRMMRFTGAMLRRAKRTGTVAVTFAITAILAAVIAIAVLWLHIRYS